MPDLRQTIPKTTDRLLLVDHWPDDSGHRWQRLLFDGHLADMRCADCAKRPLDLIKNNLGELEPCRFGAAQEQKP